MSMLSEEGLEPSCGVGQDRVSSVAPPAMAPTEDFHPYNSIAEQSLPFHHSIGLIQDSVYIGVPA